jgi:hypothetical protein
MAKAAKGARRKTRKKAMRNMPVDTRSAADPGDDAFALVDMPPPSPGLQGP